MEFIENHQQIQKNQEKPFDASQFGFTSTLTNPLILSQRNSPRQQYPFLSMFTGSASFTNGNEMSTINKKQTENNMNKKQTDVSENLETQITHKSQQNQIMRNPLSQQAQIQKFSKKLSDYNEHEKINKYQVKSQTARSGREFQIKVTNNEDEIQLKRNKAAIYSIKNMKHRSDLPIYKQFLIFQENQTFGSNQYFQNKKIETITEDEIQKGVKSLEILFDSQKLKEIQNKIVERNNEKEITKIQNMLSKKVTDQEKKDKTISPIMFAQILPGMDNPTNFTNIDKNEINEQIQKLEKKEIGVIENLYLTHFKNAKDQKIQNVKDSEYLQVQNDDQYNFFTQQSEQILKQYTGSDQEIKKTNQQMDMTQVKYIQYLPKKLGCSKYNFDKAIKSLYTISPTNISQNPDRRKKNFTLFQTSQLDQNQKLYANSLSPKSDNNGFLYGHHENSCYGRHTHSRECSKVKDVDLAQLQSLAFQFILLQKPLMALGVTKENLPKKFQQNINEQDFQQLAQASFFPEAKISLQLQESIDESEKIKNFLNTPIYRLDHLISQSKELASRIQEIDLQEILHLRNHLIDFISKQNSQQNSSTINFNQEQNNQQKKYPNQIIQEQLKKVLSEGMQRCLLDEKDTNAKEEQLKTLLGSILTREQTIKTMKLKNYRRKVRNHIEKYQESVNNNEMQYLINDPFLRNAPLVQILSDYFIENQQNLVNIQTGQQDLLTADRKASIQTSRTARSIANYDEVDQSDNFQKLNLGVNVIQEQMINKSLKKNSYEQQINKSQLMNMQTYSGQRSQQTSDELLELTKQTKIITTQKSRADSPNIDELISNTSRQDRNNTTISVTSPAKITKSKYYKPVLNFQNMLEQQTLSKNNLLISQLNSENIQKQKQSNKTQQDLNKTLKLIEKIKQELQFLEDKLLESYEELIQVTNQIEQRKEKGYFNKKEWKSPFEYRMNLQNFQKFKMKAQAKINFDKVVLIRADVGGYSQWNQQELHKRKKEIIQEIISVQQKAKMLVQDQGFKGIKSEVEAKEFDGKNEFNVQASKPQDGEDFINPEIDDTGTRNLPKDFKFYTAEKIQLMDQIQQRTFNNNTLSAEKKDFDEEATSNYAYSPVTIDRPKSTKDQKYSEPSADSQKGTNVFHLILTQNQTLNRRDTNERSNESNSPQLCSQDHKLYTQNSQERQRIKVQLSKDDQKDREDNESFIEEQQAIHVEVRTPTRNVKSPLSQKTSSASKLQAQFMKVKEQRFTKAQLASKWNTQKSKMIFSTISSGYGPSGLYPGYAQPLLKERSPAVHNQDIIHSFVEQGDLLSSGEKSKEKSKKKLSKNQGMSEKTLSNSEKKKSRNLDNSSIRITLQQKEFDEQIHLKKTPKKVIYSPVKGQAMDFMNFSNIHMPKQGLSNFTNIPDDKNFTGSFDQKDNFDILSSSSKKRVLSVTIKTNQVKQFPMYTMPTNALPTGRDRESSIHSTHQGLVDYKLDVDLPNLYEEALAKQKSKMESKVTQNKIIVKEEIKMQKVLVSPKTLQIGQNFKKDSCSVAGVITKLSHKISKN